MCDNIKVFGENINPGDEVTGPKVTWKWSKKAVADGVRHSKGLSYKGWNKVGMPITEYQIGNNVVMVPGDKRVSVIYKKNTAGDKGEFLVLQYPLDDPSDKTAKTIELRDKPKPMPKPVHKTLTIVTSHISYRGPGRLDCTMKGQGFVAGPADRASISTFGPTRQMVNRVRNTRSAKPQVQQQVAREYTAEYTQMMRKSYHHRKNEWLAAVNSGFLVLVCYCRQGEFCHRHILSDFMQKVAERHGIQVNMAGEMSPEQIISAFEDADDEYKLSRSC